MSGNGRASEATCAVDGCTKGVWARGWCGTHYTRWHKYGDPTTLRRVPAGPACAAPGCEKPRGRSYYCTTHKSRLVRLGSLELPPTPKVQPNLTTYRTIRRPGHPLAWASGDHSLYEHRFVLFEAIGPGWHPCHRCGMSVSWELSYPESPDALVVDHLDEDRGNNALENLAPSCAPCNIQRSSRWVKLRREATT